MIFTRIPHIGIIMAAVAYCSTNLQKFNVQKSVQTTYINGMKVSLPVPVLTLQPGTHVLHFGEEQCSLCITQTRSSGVDARLQQPPSWDSTFGGLVQAIVNTAAQRLHQQPCTMVVEGNPSAPLALPGMDRTGEVVDWMAIDGTTSLAVVPRLVVHHCNLLHRGIGVLILDQEGRVFVHQRSATKRLFPSMYDMFVGGVSAAGEPPGETLLRELGEEVGLDFAPPGAMPVPVEPPDAVAVAVAGSGSVENLRADDQSDMAKEGTEGGAERGVERVAEGGGEEGGDITKRRVGTGKRAVAAILRAYQSSPLSPSRISYLGKTTIQTSYNHCMVDCYAAVCSAAQATRVQFNDGEVQWGEWFTPEALDAMVASKEEEFVPDGLQVWWALAGMGGKQAPVRS